MKNAILIYRVGKISECNIVNTPAMLPDGKWSDLVIFTLDNDLLEYQPSNLTVELYDEKGWVIERLIISSIYSYEKDGDGIRVRFKDCTTRFL